MFVKSKFMHAMYTHAEITSRSLKKSLESAKLKIISSIHRPRDTAFEESCRAKDKVALRNNAKEGRANTQGAAFWLLPSVTEEGGRIWLLWRRRPESTASSHAQHQSKLPSWCGCSARQCHWRIWHLKSNHSHWIFQHGEALAVIILALSVQQLPVCLIKQQLFPPPLLSSPLLKLFIRTVTVSFLGGARYLSIKLLSSAR